jgi:hypothetical protein
MIRTSTSLALAAACLLTISAMPSAHAQYAGPPQVVTNGPQTDPGDVSPNWSARRNVIESQHYDRLVETNRAFRQARMRKECGPINDPQLHADCLASFNRDEPFVGSSTPPKSYRSGYGR